MSQAKTILILAFLVLSFPIGVRGESLSSELHLRQADAADMERRTIEAEHAPDSVAWRYSIKSVAKRRIDTSALSLVTRGLIMHTCDRTLGRSCRSSAAVVYQAAPLYQSLHVYRF